MVEICRIDIERHALRYGYDYWLKKQDLDGEYRKRKRKGKWKIKTKVKTKRKIKRKRMLRMIIQTNNLLSTNYRFSFLIATFSPSY